MNPYEILELQSGATSEEVRAAYHRLAKQWHPDRFPSGPEKEEAEARFRRLSEAFNMLKDVARKSEPVPVRVDPPPPADRPVETPTASPDPKGKGPEDWFRDAVHAREGGDSDRALALTQYALRLDAGKADFHLLLADLLEERGGDRRPIVKALETVLQLDPKHVDAMVRLSQHYRELGMQARAEGILKRAKTLSPDHKALRALKAEAPPAARPHPTAATQTPKSFLDQIREAIAKFTKRS